MKKWLKKIKEILLPTPDDERDFTAHEMCIRTMYENRQPIDNEKRLLNFIKSINNLIISKTISQDFICLCSIPSDLLEYKIKIINTYKSRGFIVLELNEKGFGNTIAISWKYGCTSETN